MDKLPVDHMKVATNSRILVCSMSPSSVSFLDNKQVDSHIHLSIPPLVDQKNLQSLQEAFWACWSSGSCQMSWAYVEEFEYTLFHSNVAQCYKFMHTYIIEVAYCAYLFLAQQLFVSQQIFFSWHAANWTRIEAKKHYVLTDIPMMKPLRKYQVTDSLCYSRQAICSISPSIDFSKDIIPSLQHHYTAWLHTAHVHILQLLG